MTAPTKIEAALADVDEAIAYFAERADVFDGIEGYPEANTAMRQDMALTEARATLAQHIAAQDAEIARLTAAQTPPRSEGVVTESLQQCLDAMNLHVQMYPHMDKGFMVDARRNATAALAARGGEKGDG